jgi:hypothetical protein
MLTTGTWPILRNAVISAGNPLYFIVGVLRCDQSDLEIKYAQQNIIKVRAKTNKVIPR